jgi:uncharacterized membrane protein
MRFLPGRTAFRGIALPFASRTVYAELMNESTDQSSSSSLGRMVVAVLILAVAAWVLLHFVIGIVTFLASILVVVVAIAAVIWAVRVLL